MKQILIVEDDSFLNKMLAYNLTADGYGVAGIIAFLIMRQLGEMVVEEPVSGSFAHFAYKYWGDTRR